jgi:hypothetical protein
VAAAAKADLSVPAPVYDIDVDNPARIVDESHAQGDRAICYFSVGTYEPFRDDAAELRFSLTAFR